EATVRLTPLTAHVGRQAAPDEAQVGSHDDVQQVTAPERQKPEAPKKVAREEKRSRAPSAESTAVSVDEELEGVVTEIVQNLLRKMGYEEATTSVERTEPDDKTGRVMTVVQVEGTNLSALIGPHGETLNDFQYIARLMAGHALRRRADFIVDVDRYRSQRKESLSSLARRMAKKAVERGSPVTLEPMSSYDRRIIHMALRDHGDVYTSSVGEGSNRRVRVYLKNQDE
ncbi:MAG TPA: R3H domain-containing nucleic acid-binding protein, partial [Candidatus Binatia bacterium]|nr:R3H domain-containing nucleic acid-binding protein [Candidatus Binatia bacterium]